jgi:1,4-alpha-glucan branching enzyme
MIKKKFVKSRKVTKLTFELPKDADLDNVHLLADFNDWQPIAFEKLKNGKWKLIQEVSPEESYQFRYMTQRDGDYHFFNDDAADTEIANPLGTTNSVIQC